MGSKILLADDSITIQKVVNLTFVDEGIEVVTVSNGEMAQRRLAEVNPDLVLADIFMPGKNGYELCQFVKDSPQFKDVPVVLLVGAFEPFDQAEARRVRADGHLTKPFESRALVETVRNLIQSSKARRPSKPLTPPPVAAFTEPPAQDFSDLISEPFDSTPTTRPLEMPFHLQEPDFSADSPMAADPGQTGHQVDEPPAATTIPFLPLELDGVNEPVQANGHGHADANAPLSLDIPDVEYSAPAGEVPVMESAPVGAAFADHGGDHIGAPVSEPVASTFEPLDHQERPPLRVPHPVERTTTSAFDPSVEFSEDLDGPAEKDFAFQPVHFGAPEVDVEPPAESKGFGFEISESSPPQHVTVGETVHAASAEPIAAGWETVEPSVQAEGSSQNFELFEEPAIPPPAPIPPPPPVVVQHHEETSEPAIAISGFAADDDPLGDILEGPDTEVGAPIETTATVSSYVEHEVPAPEVIAAPEPIAEGGSYAYGFDLVTPVHDSNADSSSSHAEEVGSSPVVATGVVDELGQEQHDEESPLGSLGIHAGNIEPPPAVHEAEHWGEQPGAVFTDGGHASNESAFDVISVETSEPVAAPEASPHSEFFISSFPASERAEFTSADLWNERQPEPIAAAPASPAVTSKETPSATADRGSWLDHTAQESTLAGETGFEFSHLIEEEAQAAATPEGQRVNGADLSFPKTPAAMAPSTMEIARDTQPLAVPELQPEIAQAPAAAGPQDAERSTGVPLVPAAEGSAAGAASAEASADIRAGHASGVAEPVNGNVPDLSRAAIDEIVRRVIMELTDTVVREIAWEVVPECVERVVEKLSREGVSKTA